MNFEIGSLPKRFPIKPERAMPRNVISAERKQSVELRKLRLMKWQRLKLQAMELARTHDDVREDLSRFELELERMRQESKKSRGEMDAAERLIVLEIRRILNPVRAALTAEVSGADPSAWHQVDQGWQEVSQSSEREATTGTVSERSRQTKEESAVRIMDEWKMIANRVLTLPPGETPRTAMEKIGSGNPAEIRKAFRAPVIRRVDEMNRRNASERTKETGPIISEKEIVAAVPDATVRAERYFMEHPAGPELDPEPVREVDAAAAEGLMRRIRKNRLFGPLMKSAAGMITFFTLALPVKQFQEQGNAEAAQMQLAEEGARTLEALKRPGVQQQLVMRFEQELEQMDPARVEGRGVTGDPSWSVERQETYQSLGDLKSKFRFLHQQDLAALEALDNPETLIVNYRKIVQLALYEFPHTILFRQLTRDAVNAALDVLPHMADRAKAAALYQQLKADIMQVQGARPAFDLEYSMQTAVPDGHPLKELIRQSPMMKSGFAESIFRAHKNNKIIFDQRQGTIGIFRAAEGGQLIRLDTHPANGGKPDAVPYGQGDVHTHVRTPDGTYRLGGIEAAVSPYWQNAWLPNGTKLVLSSDGVNIDYMDNDGTSHRLTGEDAEFMGQKPFRQKEGSFLYRAATVTVDGKPVPPAPFSAEQMKKLFRYDGSSSAIGAWEWNEFGSRALRIYQGKERTHLLVHTNPSDNGEEIPLASSHGCVRVKSEAIDDMVDLLPVDAELIIRSGTPPTKE